MLTTALLVVLILVLVGGAVPWGPWAGPAAPGQPARTSLFHGYGYGNPVGAVLIVLLIVLLLSVLGVL